MIREYRKILHYFEKAQSKKHFKFEVYDCFQDIVIYTEDYQKAFIVIQDMIDLFERVDVLRYRMVKHSKNNS